MTLSSPVDSGGVISPRAATPRSPLAPPLPRRIAAHRAQRHRTLPHAARSHSYLRARPSQAHSHTLHAPVRSSAEQLNAVTVHEHNAIIILSILLCYPDSSRHAARFCRKLQRSGASPMSGFQGASEARPARFHPHFRGTCHVPSFTHSPRAGMSCD